MAKNNQILLDIGKGLTLAVGLPTIGIWEGSNRPKNAKRGTLGFNTETNSVEFFDGTIWFRAQMVKA